MARQKTPAPTTGRPRTNPLKPGYRPQISFTIDQGLMNKVRASAAISGRSQSAEFEHRVARTYVADDVMTLRYGKRHSVVLTMIADAMETAWLWGQALAEREDGWRGSRKALAAHVLRIDAASREAARLVLDIPALSKMDRPPPGPPTWETLALVAAFAAYDRAWKENFGRDDSKEGRQ
jgi:hypothetical protein